MAQSAVTGRVGPDLLSAFGPRELEHTKTREKERARERERESQEAGRRETTELFLSRTKNVSLRRTHTLNSVTCLVLCLGRLGRKAILLCYEHSRQNRIGIVASYFTSALLEGGLEHQKCST